MTISRHAKEANLGKKAIMYQVYEPSKQIGALIECLTYFVFQMIKTSETLEAACGPFRECLAVDGAVGQVRQFYDFSAG